MSVERIFLTGFMTSGKSTIGPILANVIGWDFYDLDKEIEQKEGMKINEIFSSKGEEYFRHIETETLIGFSEKTGCIIALGGGTILSDINFSIIKKSGKFVYLRASAEMLYRRVRNKIDRPAFRDMVLNELPKEDFLKKINQLLDERKAKYEQADLIINTDKQRIGKTIDLIAKMLKRYRLEHN